jgi:hypothetical protein
MESSAAESSPSPSSCAGRVAAAPARSACSSTSGVEGAGGGGKSASAAEMGLGERGGAPDLRLRHLFVLAAVAAAPELSEGDEPRLVGEAWLLALEGVDPMLLRMLQPLVLTRRHAWPGARDMVGGEDAEDVVPQDSKTAAHGGLGGGGRKCKG